VDRQFRRQAARVVTEILAPAPVVAALLVAVAVHSATDTASGVGWATLAVLFASVIPILYVLRGVRRRRLSDRHVRMREQRALPLTVGIGSVLIGLFLLAVLGAPRDLVALVAAMAVGLASSLLVTLAWKISVHTAVAAGAAVILVLVFGPALAVAGLGAALAGWSRVELGDHTIAQVIGGSALGVAVAWSVFSLLR
jgi:membrane-associated phospholipid phosphatase